jgi:hypothetical protein
VQSVGEAEQASRRARRQHPKIRSDQIGIRFRRCTRRCSICRVMASAGGQDDEQRRHRNEGGSDQRDPEATPAHSTATDAIASLVLEFTPRPRSPGVTISAQ